MRAWILPVMACACACRSPGSAAPPPPPAPASASDPAPSPSPAPASIDAAAPAPETDWCLAGLSVLDEETCYLLPPLAAGKPRRLLVYLHGIVPPLPTSPQKENVMTAVRNAATHAGAAALVPRGVRGVGPSHAKDWWGWPTSPDAHARLAAGLAARILREKAKLEAVAGAPFERTYLAGSSSGAYFATNLVLRGEIEVDALGAMSGGASWGIARKRPLPVYIGYGTYDDSARHGVVALARALERAGFPVKIAGHPFGHGAREVYIDEAFAFWDGAVP